MSDVSVIGLGVMGTALARVLIDAGCDVTVWNRSPGRVKPLAASGARVADNPAAAISASPITVVCVLDYTAADDFLTSKSVRTALQGRTIVQFSTGSPQDAQECADHCQSCGAEYLDGVLLTLPRHVGTEAAQVLISGSEAAFKKHHKLLGRFGGDFRYLGTNVRAAAALDMAWLSQRLGMLIGGIHGALICESEGVDVANYANLFGEDDRMRILVNRIANADFDQSDSSMQIWNCIVERYLMQAQGANISKEFPEFVAGLIKRAVQSGYGDKDISALAAVLRSR